MKEFLAMLSDSGTVHSLTALDVVITVVLAALLGLVIATVYKYTSDSYEYTQDFSVTLVMLCVIISVVVAAVGSNVARAFSFAGVLSIIRFRTVMGNPRDIAFVLFSVSAGLCVGVSAYLYAVIIVAALLLLIVIMRAYNVFAPKGAAKRLKITIAENMNYEGVFDGVLEKYCIKYDLSKVSTVDLGTLFELVYDVEVKNDVSEKDMMDDIRCKNGNLPISLILAPKAAK